MHVSLVDFLTKNGIQGTSSLLVLIFCLFFLYFSGMPGGASEGPAGPPSPESVGKALQCVRLIGMWRATSKNQQHDSLRRMVNIEHTSHYTSSTSSALNSLSKHAMGKKQNHRTPHALLFPCVCIVCRAASVVLTRSTEWSTIGTDWLFGKTTAQ